MSNNKILSKSAQRVQDALSQKGLIIEVDKQTINTIFIDENLLNYETLWAAAGTPNAVFSLSATHLEQLTNGQIISIK